MVRNLSFFFLFDVNNLTDLLILLYYLFPYNHKNATFQAKTSTQTFLAGKIGISREFTGIYREYGFFFPGFTGKSWEVPMSLFSTPLEILVLVFAWNVTNAEVVTDINSIKKNKDLKNLK